MKSFFFELYDSFTRINGWLFGLLGTALAIALWAWKPEATVRIVIVVPIIVALLFVIVILFDSAYQLYRSIWKPPRVIRANPAPELYKDGLALLLLNKSEMFGQDFLVSIYLQEDSFELLVGLGVVINIQFSGLVQVLVIQNTDSKQKDLWKDVLSNDCKHLDKLLVKPSIPKSYYTSQVHS
jgi:hypothetical protein